MASHAQWRLVFAAATAVATVATVAAGAAPGLSTKLYAYPGYDASWTRQAGLPDATGGGSYGLVLSKTERSVDDLHGGGADVSGVPSSVRELGFDLKSGSVCASYLMFRITTPDGAHHDIPCSAGTQTPLSSGWTRVRIDPASYGSLSVSDLKLRLAMPSGSTGSSTVDNLDVNGTLVDR